MDDINDEIDFDYEDFDEKVIMASKEEQDHMNEFYEWLKSVDGGLRQVRSALQHRDVVMNILHFLYQSGKHYEKLFW